jgi:hypothetical protein
MQVSIGKLLSLVIAIAYAVVAVKHAGVAGLEWSVGLLLPLALIWFPEEIGSLTGYYKTGYVNTQTPGVVMSCIGWLFLVGMPVLAWVITS